MKAWGDIFERLGNEISDKLTSNLNMRELSKVPSDLNSTFLKYIKEAYERGLTDRNKSSIGEESYKSIKIKIFKDESVLGHRAEEKANDFLSTINQSQIIEIKMSTSYEPDSLVGMVIVTIMVIYRDISA